MVKKSIKIELSSGLEARPAAMLVQVASQYDSKIYLEADSKRKEYYGYDDSWSGNR